MYTVFLLIPFSLRSFDFKNPKKKGKSGKINTKNKVKTTNKSIQWKKNKLFPRSYSTETHVHTCDWKRERQNSN